MFSTVQTTAPAMLCDEAERERLPLNGPVCAILDVEVDGDFRPKKASSVRCDGLPQVPVRLLNRLAIDFNRSNQAIKRNRWACLSTTGILFFVRIPPEDRPEDPAAFPPTARNGMTPDQAQEAMLNANADRLRLARIPRHWTVALRPLDQRSADDLTVNESGGFKVWIVGERTFTSLDEAESAATAIAQQEQRAIQISVGTSAILQRRTIKTVNAPADPNISMETEGGEA